MRRVILDTDVASLSIKQQLPATLLRELLGAQIGITFITLGELTRWATLRQWGPTRPAELDAWLTAYSRYLPPATAKRAGIFAGLGNFLSSTVLQMAGAAAVTAVGVANWDGSNPHRFLHLADAGLAR